MSILIRDMDMPKNCDSCPFFDDIYTHMDDGDVYICSRGVGLTYLQYIGEEPKDDCPLVEVPKYGRLIDAAELQREAYGMLFRGHADDRDVAFLNFVLRKVPTVATAEEEAEE